MSLDEKLKEFLERNSAHTNSLQNGDFVAQLGEANGYVKVSRVVVAAGEKDRLNYNGFDPVKGVLLITSKDNMPVTYIDVVSDPEGYYKRSSELVAKLLGEEEAFKKRIEDAATFTVIDWPVDEHIASFTLQFGKEGPTTLVENRRIERVTFTLLKFKEALHEGKLYVLDMNCDLLTKIIGIRYVTV